MQIRVFSNRCGQVPIQGHGLPFPPFLKFELRGLSLGGGLLWWYTDDIIGRHVLESDSWLTSLRTLSFRKTLDFMAGSVPKGFTPHSFSDNWKKHWASCPGQKIATVCVTGPFICLPPIAWKALCLLGLLWRCDTLWAQCWVLLPVAFGLSSDDTDFPNAF